MTRSFLFWNCLLNCSYVHIIVLCFSYHCNAGGKHISTLWTNKLKSNQSITLIHFIIHRHPCYITSSCTGLNGILVHLPSTVIHVPLHHQAKYLKKTCLASCFFFKSEGGGPFFFLFFIQNGRSKWPLKMAAQNGHSVHFPWHSGYFSRWPRTFFF